jgi:transcriptional regulator with XRE-family HTH domain
MEVSKMRLREIRVSKRLTQKELAAISGVCQPHISSIENGTATPTITTAQKLAKSLGCTIDDLVRQKEA